MTPCEPNLGDTYQWMYRTYVSVPALLCPIRIPIFPVAAYSPFLKMEVTFSSKTDSTFNTTRQHTCISKERNIKSGMFRSLYVSVNRLCVIMTWVAIALLLHCPSGVWSVAGDKCMPVFNTGVQHRTNRSCILDAASHLTFQILINLTTYVHPLVSALKFPQFYFWHFCFLRWLYVL
jgi:hypothetical protein